MEEVSGPVVAIALILVGGVRAHRLHPGHHRPALPAVRRDHRDLGDHLGLQRPDAQPGAVGPAAAAARSRRAARWAGSSEGSTGSSAGPPTATSGCAALLIRKCAVSMLLLVGFAVAGRRGSAGSCPPASCPRRTRATSTWTCSCPTPPRCSAPTQVCQEGREDPAEDARRGVLHHGRRLQPAERRAEHLQRVLLRHAQGLGRAQGARRSNTRPSWRT